MIRKSTLSLNFANSGKLNILDDIIIEYNQIVNFFINYLWDNNLLSGKFVNSKIFNNFSMLSKLSSRMIRMSAHQALHICKSQQKKRKKTKPVFNKFVMELDERFFQLYQDVKTKEYDCWFKFSSLFKRGSNPDKITKIFFPSKKHNHFNKLIEQDFSIKKSCRIRKNDSGYFLDIFFEKPENPKKTKGRRIGIDVGYKKLAITSDGYNFGKDIEKICEKISRKKRNSKSYKRALIERDEYINKSVKLLYNFYPRIKEIKVENLKNVKYKSKFSNKFNNKLQYWSYKKFLDRLQLISEINGVQISKVNPAYTSQTCHICNNSDKLSRQNEIYECRRCGRIFDVDHNAAINIFMKEG